MHNTEEQLKLADCSKKINVLRGVAINIVSTGFDSLINLITKNSMERILTINEL